MTANKKKLFRNYFVPLNNSYVIFFENNYCYLYNNSSARKFNDDYRFIIFLNLNEIVKIISIFMHNNKKYQHWYFLLNERITEYKRIKYFKEFFYENKGRIKIVGRGWKIIKFEYQLLIKLGYSHMIFLELSPFFRYKLKRKKDKYYVFYGAFHNEINSILNKIRLMRIPDTYTKKGIFHRTITL